MPGNHSPKNPRSISNFRYPTLLTRSDDLQNPRAIRRISDITNLINDAKAIGRDLDALVEARLLLTEEAIEATGLQSETAYSVGQEMIVTGAKLSHEAKTASPGRSAQISAAASSAQMLASGTMLQTMSQVAQIQAIELELKRSEMEREKKAEEARKKATQEFMRRKR